MFKFFRKLRFKHMKKDSTSKYLKYAIGEIILVVLGILIALQINNWNESRKAQIKERLVLNNLIEDLKSDSTTFNRNIKTLTTINSLHKKLYEYGFKNNDTISINNPSYIRRLLYYNPLTKENDPFIASKISNDTVRKEIMNYFRILKDVDNVHGEFIDVIQDRVRIYLAEKELHQLDAWFEKPNTNEENDFYYLNLNTSPYKNIVKEDDIKRLSKLPEFQQILFEAAIKSNETLSAIEKAARQNDKLKETITLLLKK